MQLEAFHKYSLNETMYLYLMSRMPAFGQQVSRFLGQKLVVYNGSRAVYTIQDDLLEYYFQQLDQQVRNENIQHVDEFKSEFKTLAQTLMDLYPNGIKHNTTKYWRGNIFEVSRKLETLNSILPIDADECINATKKYVESFNGDYIYMRTLPYFILKSYIEDGKLQYSSDLLTVIENLKHPEQNLPMPQEDWIADLK